MFLLRHLFHLSSVKFIDVLPPLHFYCFFILGHNLESFVTIHLSLFLHPCLLHVLGDRMHLGKDIDEGFIPGNVVVHFHFTS